MVLATCMLVLAACAESVAPLTGRAAVIDGDTIEIAGKRIRMVGIDAPESGQSCADEAGNPWRCGTLAARALDDMIGARTVTCEIDPRDPQDRYGRALGLCSAGGVSLSVEMVRQGWAVAYVQYLDYRDHTPRAYKAPILAAEAEAKAARRNIWRGDFILPWEWRASRRR